MNLRTSVITKLLPRCALTVLLAFAGCDNSPAKPSPPAMSTESTPVTEDIGELGRRINLPVTPLAVRWQVQRIGPSNSGGLPGPSTTRLRALIKFADGDLQTLIRGQTPLAAAGLVGEDYFESWFPPSVKEMWASDPATGKYRIKTPLYDAGLFAKASYRIGTFFVTSAGEVCLTLSSM